MITRLHHLKITRQVMNCFWDSSSFRDRVNTSCMRLKDRVFRQTSINVQSMVFSHPPLSLSPLSWPQRCVGFVCRNKINETGACSFFLIFCISDSSIPSHLDNSSGALRNISFTGVCVCSCPGIVVLLSCLSEFMTITEIISPNHGY